jgi:hypothetical protein
LPFLMLGEQTQSQAFLLLLLLLLLHQLLL